MTRFCCIRRTAGPSRRFADDQRCLTPAVVQRTSNEDKQAIEEELLAFRQEDGSWKQCEAIITAASDSRLQCTPANPPPPSPLAPSPSVLRASSRRWQVVRRLNSRKRDRDYLACPFARGPGLAPQPVLVLPSAFGCPNHVFFRADKAGLQRRRRLDA